MITDVWREIELEMIPQIPKWMFFVSVVHSFIFFSACERAVFNKSCNLIGSESGQYSPHPARSQQAVSGRLRDEITSIASLQLSIY